MRLLRLPAWSPAWPRRPPSWPVPYGRNARACEACVRLPLILQNRCRLRNRRAGKISLLQLDRDPLLAGIQPVRSVVFLNLQRHRALQVVIRLEADAQNLIGPYIGNDEFVRREPEP